MVEGPDKEPVIHRGHQRSTYRVRSFLVDRPPSTVPKRNVDRRLESLELAPVACPTSIALGRP
jgi:hypothetical protein